MRQYKNGKYWAISSEGSNRTTFNDYPLCSGVKPQAIGGLKKQTIYYYDEKDVVKYMIDLNQIVETTWNGYTKKHYIDLGYQYTKQGDTFEVKVRDLPENSKIKIDCQCDECMKKKRISYIDYNKVIRNNSGNYICKTCKDKINLRSEDMSQEMYDRFLCYCKSNDYIPISTIDDYINSKTKLRYICKKHGEQSISSENIKEGKRCNQCAIEHAASLLRHGQDDVNEIIVSKGSVWKNYGEYVNTSTSNLNVVCTECGTEFTTSLMSIMNGACRCKYCGQRAGQKLQSLSYEEIIKRCTIDGEIKILNPSEYINNTTKNLKFVCSNCGKEYVTSLVLFMEGKILCEDCSNKKSVVEFLCQDFLNANKISFVPQKTYLDCIDKKCLPFDFYIPEKNMIIEIDGSQHFYIVYRGRKHLDYVKKHDRIKNWYCIKNGIRLVRIPFWDFNKINYILEEILLNNSEEMYLKYSIIQ